MAFHLTFSDVHCLGVRSSFLFLAFGEVRGVRNESIRDLSALYLNPLFGIVMPVVHRIPFTTSWLMPAFSKAEWASRPHFPWLVTGGAFNKWTIASSPI